jgi:hypothetical protein
MLEELLPMAQTFKTVALAAAFAVVAAPAFAQVPPQINPLGVDLDPLHIFTPDAPPPPPAPEPMMMHHHHHHMMMRHHMMHKKMMMKKMDEKKMEEKK